MIFAITLCLRTGGANSALFGALARGRGSRVVDVPVSCHFVGGSRGLTLVRHVDRRPSVGSGVLASVGCLGNVSKADVRARGSGQRDDLRIGVVGIPGGFFRFVGVPVLSKRILGAGDSVMTSHGLMRHVGGSLLKAALCGCRSDCAMYNVYSSFMTSACGRDRNFIFLPYSFGCCMNRYCLGYMPKGTRRMRTFIGGVLRRGLPPDVRLRVSALRRSVRRTRTVRGGVGKVVLFFSFIDLVVALLNICSTVALSARHERGRITVHGMGNTKLGRVVVLFTHACVCRLMLSTAVTFPLYCTVLRL